MTTRKLRRRMIDEPTQSDATLLLKVEDLIHLAMGPNDQNVVNFKLLQTILYILARQMRLLDQKVELKAGEKQDVLSEVSVTEEESSEGPSRVSKKPIDKDKRKSRDVDSERVSPEDKKGGRGKSADRDTEDEREYAKRGGKGRGKDMDEDTETGRGKGSDRESPEGKRRGGRGKDESPEGKGRRDRDRDDEYDGGRGKGGPERKGKGGRERDEESPESARRGGRGRDEESPESARKGGGRSDDEGPEGRRKDRSRGRDEEGPDGKGKGRGAEGRGKGGEGRGGEGAEGRGKGGEGPQGRGRGGGLEGRGRDEEGPEGRGRGGEGAGGRGKGGEGAGGRGRGGRDGRGRDESDEERGSRKDRSGDRGRDGDRDDSRGRGGKGEGRGGEGRGRGEGTEGRGRGGDRGGRDEDAESRGRGGGAGGRGRGGEGTRGPGRGGPGAEGGWEGEDGEGGGRGGRGGEGWDEEGDKGGGGKDGRKGTGGKGKRPAGIDDKSYEGGGWDDDKGGRKGGAGGPGGPRGGRGTSAAGKDAGGRPSTSSIAVSEKSRDRDKVLVVGKGPRAGAQPTRVGSVEVVTQKEFATLANAVKALQEKAGPLPTPTLPDNKKLRDDIVKGSASLMDTMQAMRLAARVQAAEKAIDTMADLLTHLASQGVLPPEVARAAEELHDEVVAVRREIEAASGKGESVSDKKGRKGYEPRTGGAVGSPSGVSTVSGGTAGAGVSRYGRPGPAFDSKAPIVHSDLDEALQQMKDEIMQNMSSMMNRAAGAADAAALHVKSISDKMEVATKLDNRVSLLHSLVNDYAEQLAGFDSGLSTQMSGFQEQMAQMRTDLNGGLQQLEQVNNNAETAAVLELTERYEGLVSELDSTLHAHQGLTAYQRELSDELRSLVEAVEMMREQKADRDEVQDGLRDKADSSRLEGLLTDEQFQHARESLEIRMEMCYDKFRKQDGVWMDVVRDFARVSETKAELMQLLSIREEAQQELRELNCKVKQLARMLGDPKAAIITRKLAKDAACAVCRVPALMEPVEPLQPFSLPMARLPPTGAPAEPSKEPEFVPCMKELLIAAEAEEDEQPPHYCRRWVGGSHTLIGYAPGLGNVSRKKAKQFPFSHPSKKYLGYGKDGKLYKLEDMEPAACVECNEVPKAPTPEVVEAKIPGEADMGAEHAAEGDPASRRVTLVDASTARRVTVVDENELVQALEAEVALASPDGSRRPTVTEDGPPRPMPKEVPRNSLEEESDKAPTGTESTTDAATDVTEVAVRDMTAAATRPSVIVEVGSRRATVVGDVDTFPTLENRVSTVARASAIAMAHMSRRSTEVGTGMKGQATAMAADEAEREAILKKIADDRADKQARGDGETGGGTPAHVQEVKEEEKEEAKQ